MEDLVRRAQRGDTRALACLVDELAPYVGRICGAIALDAGEDAAQDALVAVCRNIHALRDPAALRGWVRRIAVREAIRVARQARREPPIDTGVVAPDIPRFGDDATAVEIRAVLDGLAPEHRAVLVLRHVDDMTEEEMSDALGVPAGTVKSRLNRARTAFRQGWTA